MPACPGCFSRGAAAALFQRGQLLPRSRQDWIDHLVPKNEALRLQRLDREA
jgi:hypothetical protein